MAIVVSDTSPIRALHHLGLLPILEQLYQQVYLPTAVADDLRRAGRRFPALDPATHLFFILVDPEDSARVRQLEERLHTGEAAAIAVALERQADYILIDERAGRSVAHELGLTVIGVLGILFEAKRLSLVPNVAPLLTRLQTELDFRLAPVLVRAVLQQAGE